MTFNLRLSEDLPPTGKQQAINMYNDEANGVTRGLSEAALAPFCIL